MVGTMSELDVYDESIKRWAAGKLDSNDWTSVSSVTFGTDRESCGEGTCDWEVPLIVIQFSNGQSSWLYPDDMKLSFGEMIRQIAEISATLASPSPTGIRSLQDEASDAYQEAKQARKERDDMRMELQKVIRTARNALAQHVAALEWLGQGVD